MLRITMDTTDGSSLPPKSALTLIALLRAEGDFEVKRWGFDKVREVDGFVHYALWVEVDYYNTPL